MNELPIPFRIRTGFSAAPGIIMGLAFLATWIEPTAIGENMLSYFGIIMLLEFITIHSAAFMGWAIVAGQTTFKKVTYIVGLGLFYSLFVAAFTSEGVWWPLGAFWLLILNRLFSALFGDGNTASRQITLMASWGWGVFWYVMAIMITTFLPLPALGWTKEYLSTITVSESGLWFEDPQSLFAAGFLYFTAVGSFELFSHKISAKFSDIDPKIPLFRKNP